MFYGCVYYNSKVIPISSIYCYLVKVSTEQMTTYTEMNLFLSLGYNIFHGFFYYRWIRIWLHIISSNI